MTSRAPEHWAVTVHQSRAAAVETLRVLALSGLDMARWSVVAKISAEQDDVGLQVASARFHVWGAPLRDWQCLWTLLLERAFFFVPSVGHIVVMGPLVGAITDVLEGFAGRGSSGALSAVLVSLGVEAECARQHEQAVAKGKALVFANGDHQLIDYANAALEAHGSAPLLTRVPAGAAVERPL